MNGPKKPTRPTPVASRHRRRKTIGSSSAPARNVNRIAPVPARKVTHSDWPPSDPPITAPITSCATVPTTISERAVETLSQIASNVAKSASPTQIDARNHTFMRFPSRGLVPDAEDETELPQP